IHDIEQVIRSHSKALFHCDVTQAIGKVSFNFSKADLITFGAHKFNGLNGIGALIYNSDIEFEIQIHGGKSFSPYRSGSPTLALIASMEKALQLALQHQEERFIYVQGIRKELSEFFLSYPQVMLHSQPNYPFLLNLSVLGIKSVEMKDALDEKGICLSVRSACSSENSPSRMVQQLSGNRKAATSSIRISLSHLTTQAHIDALKQAFHACYTERIPHGKS
ncbi:MAG: aminotransferase class V-fold PLP-dependent enzyme, partial [Vallitaleaceae bacterium]|nr:aminotransferase class V-fold PLP-dependent enzyme [Vallitaleaceae bacterium]